MGTEPLKKRFLSRLATPFAKAAQLVRRRRSDDEDENELTGTSLTDLARLRDNEFRLGDEDFTLATQQLLKEETGAFQTKLHIISLAEFREGVGDRWARLADKVMMIAEGVIAMHLGSGNISTRKGNDFFILLFRTCPPEEAKRRATIIVQELGTRLMGDQFQGGEKPLAVTVELPLAYALNPDGSVNVAAVEGAVTDVREQIAEQLVEDPDSLPAWMRPSQPMERDNSVRRHLQPGELWDDGEEGGLRSHLRPSDPYSPPPAPVDDRPPIVGGVPVGEAAPLDDPGWKKLRLAKKAKEEPVWVTLDAKAPVSARSGESAEIAWAPAPAKAAAGAGVTPSSAGTPSTGAKMASPSAAKAEPIAAATPAWVPIEAKPVNRPISPKMRLTVQWRPSWVARGEAIATYVARLQRHDGDDLPPLEDLAAYPSGDAAAAQHLDRVMVANAVRDFRQSEGQGNRSTVVIPVHWDSLCSANRMDILYPLTDCPSEARSQRIVIEVLGMPLDAQPVIVRATLAHVRSLCREVMIRSNIQASHGALAAECGATMLSLDMGNLVLPERPDVGRLQQAVLGFLGQSGQKRLSACLWGIRHRPIIVAGVENGAAMVNGGALMKDIAKPAKSLPAPKAKLLKMG